MNTSKLTLTDRMGIFYGTIIFLFMLPLSIFIGAIPSVLVSNAIPNKVASLAIILGIIGADLVITFLAATVLGLACSYGLSHLGRALRIQQTVRAMIRSKQPIEEAGPSNIGGILGGALTLIAFILQGEAPVHSVTEKVEHLFPGDLVINLGSLFSVDLSHLYAATTGFLAVGFLYAIVGIVLGTLLTAIADRAIHNVRA